MLDRAWAVPPVWGGQTAFILGGGPSLAAVDLAQIRDWGPAIAINDAGLIRAPWAEVLYFADPCWAEWHRGELALFTGLYRVTRAPATDIPGVDVRMLQRERNLALSLDPRRIAGPDSGSNAINLAFLFGARRIILFGFDMRPGSWHRRHRRPEPTHRYAEAFIPSLEAMAVELKRGGVEVINATPNSALTCFPVMAPEAALGTGPDFVVG
jgi:hypothetical protein